MSAAWHQLTDVLKIQVEVRRDALHGRASHSDVPRVEVSDVAKLRAMEDENTRLKRLLADTMLERGLVRHWSEDNGRALF